MLAPAKINLDLRITGRRSDGYHLLDSIVAFTEFGDELTAELCDNLKIEISGPFASKLDVADDNLILKAARFVCEEAGVEPNLKFHLTKNLPVSSGIGGGSADAAAAMKLTRDLLALEIEDSVFHKIAVEIGADVPVCLRSVTSHMCGIGDEIQPLDLDDELHILLVNPGVSVSTPDIFNHYAASNLDFDSQRQISRCEIHLPLMIGVLKDSRNSLQTSACTLNKEVVDVLNVLGNTSGVLLSRMSGSGATCFALFQSYEDCRSAADKVRVLKENWWVKETKIR